MLILGGVEGNRPRAKHYLVGVGSRDRFRAAPGQSVVSDSPLRSDVTLYDAGLHNRSHNRARNWVHSRIWPSRDYFLSTPSTRKTTIVPLLSLVCRTARPAAARTDQMTAATRPARRAQAHADGVATTRERPTATYRCTRTRRSC